MANINEIVANALRLGTASRQMLSDEIDRCIRTAREEMIRSGISGTLAESDDDLIVDAVVTFCLIRMGDQARAEQYREAWIYQIDCIRKSAMNH